jgi:hypothetical protein
MARWGESHRSLCRHVHLSIHPLYNTFTYRRFLQLLHFGTLEKGLHGGLEFVPINLANGVRDAAGGIRRELARLGGHIVARGGHALEGVVIEKVGAVGGLGRILAQKERNAFVVVLGSLLGGRPPSTIPCRGRQGGRRQGRKAPRRRR